MASSLDLTKVKRYLLKKGIAAEPGFNCIFCSDCKSRVKKGENFTSAQECYVGSEYEKGDIPRVLFLSLDSGEGTDPDKRNMESLRRGTEIWNPLSFKTSQHWYRTHQLAWYIFNTFKAKYSLNYDIGNMLNNSNIYISDLNKICHYFAHINSAKCCFNRKHNAQACKQIFNNCKPYIPQEIVLLEPHILVTQGNYAKLVVDYAVNNNMFHLDNNKIRDEVQYICIPNGYNMESSQFSEHKRLVLWIHNYHPRYAHGFFNNNLPNFGQYSNLIMEFLEGNYASIIGNMKKCFVKDI